ncbi:MAG: aspartate aminotransferase family protein [Syntrophomonadaceae bacterium]|jgi:predicted acetylornithine/succinylornithine family transaminase|nr:aspartate aminotransferase family protein [Syntrophomonadaceae bacterium]MDH7497948.1 aspartate aminotransferase family protein [Syntrophomonadaceae bacterium]
MDNQQIMAVGSQYLMNTYARFPLALVRGRGSRVWDADGNEYVDMVAGIAVCALGHAHPALVRALEEQAHRLWHCSNLYWIKPQVELAARLCRHSGLARAFFANSGAEANEAAIKLVRKYWHLKGRPACDIVVFRNSFHGRTLAALSATGQEKYQQGFAPLVPGFAFAEFNDLESVEKAVGPHTGAVMVEPVQGEGGVRPADPAFMRGLADLCRRQGLLLVLDEVQTGMGRTGKMFAFQNFGVEPDVVTLAKGLGGGFPVGAMLARGEVAEAFAPGDHASTFGGNPLACAVACEVVDQVASYDVCFNVTEASFYLRGLLEDIARRRSDVVEVRGMGLLLGVEFTREVKPLVERCRQHGLLVIGAGERVLRMVPALTIGRDDIDAAVAILKRALDEWGQQ